MKRWGVCLLCALLLLSTAGIYVAAESIDPLQRFFVCSVSLDGDARVLLADTLKPLKKPADISEETKSKVAALFPELTAAEVSDILRIYAQRSADNQYNIQDLILFGAKEMPFLEDMPSIRKALNQSIIGDETDDRGSNFFSTLIAVYDMYTLFGGDSTIASNHALPGLVSLTISNGMPPEVVKKVSGAFQFMPSLTETLSEYPGATDLHRMFAFIEQLVNDCDSHEIYYFKFAMDKLGVFVGTAADPENNKKYPAITFRDVDAYEWAVPQISQLSSNGVINGMSRYVFAPQEDVTREQFVKLLASAFGLDETDAALPFQDAVRSEWYYPSLAAAYESGFISGESADAFGVGHSITREQMAVMLYRVCEKNIIDFSGGTSVSFADSAEISAYAQEAVQAMAAHNIIKGVGSGQFSPRASANRAQASVMIYNVLQYADLLK